MIVECGVSLAHSTIHDIYGHYCYLPLYIFCGEFQLGKRRIVVNIRRKWSKADVLVSSASACAPW
jgi:hypothetical protein